MESYKYSCPFCGQHIEYTVEYCGKQMICPSCNQTVVFPAVPPGGKRMPLRIKRNEVTHSKNWFARIREFKHWNIVVSCLVPFAIIGGLLIVAAVVKKEFGSAPPAAPAVAPVTADPNGWQKMTDFARTEQSVQQQIAIIKQDTVILQVQQQKYNSLNTYWHSRTWPDQATADAGHAQLVAAEAQVHFAQKALAAAREAFETAFRKYQQLGGTTDYRQQLPR